MDIEKFADILLKSIKEAKMPVTEVERIKDSLFGIAMSDDNQFLIKIGRREPKQEAAFLEMEESDSKIHEIYNKFADSWEYGLILKHNDFDISWLIEVLESEEYDKLEDYILHYCAKNDELLFRLGFKYAWSLFSECAEKELCVKPES